MTSPSRAAGARRDSRPRGRARSLRLAPPPQATRIDGPDGVHVSAGLGGSRWVEFWGYAADGAPERVLAAQATGGVSVSS